jgi:hypothetical protein
MNLIVVEVVKKCPQAVYHVLGIATAALLSLVEFV